MLSIDIGNSRIKWHQTGSSLGQFRSEPYSSGQLDEQLSEWFDSVTVDSSVIICSVAAASVNQLTKQYFENRQVEVCFVEVLDHWAGVRNAYKVPQSLGVDRWVAMISAYNKYKSAVCVIDAGTAVTVDVVNHEGRHQGGLIMPGLSLMRQCLVEGTVGIDRVSSESPLLADNTADAVNTGCKQLLVSGIESIIDRILHNQQPEPIVVLTGGDAGLLAASIAVDYKLDRGLILEGLEQHFYGSGC